MRLWRCLELSVISQSTDVGTNGLEGIAENEAFRLSDIVAMELGERRWGESGQTEISLAGLESSRGSQVALSVQSEGWDDPPKNAIGRVALLGTR